MIFFKNFFFRSKPKKIASAAEEVHVLISGSPARMIPLGLTIKSLMRQADTIHVFLNDFDEIPGFLQHQRIRLIRSQDFGNLGECGKYYPADDLQGYCLVCSDRLIYPEGYAKKMIANIERYGRKAVIAAGGWKIDPACTDSNKSSVSIKETEKNPVDEQVGLISDLALAYHTSTIKVSRHYFYQPELSSIWFSIIAKDQNIPLICSRNKENWLKLSEISNFPDETDPEIELYRNFLIRSYFVHDDQEPDEKDKADINAYFDRIYVMNLDRRPDRWEKIRQTAEKHNIQITRFAAVDGYQEPVRSAWEKYFKSGLKDLPSGIEPLTDYIDKFLKYHHYVARIHFMESKLGKKAMQSPGAWGYALSYISILKDAVKKNYRRILIFDDDIVLHKSFSEEFEKHMLSLPADWKLIMLGAMQHRWEPYITPYADLFYHCHGSSVASHAVGIDRKVFLPLIFYSEKLDLPVDEGAVFHIQNIYDKQCYVFLPNLAIQEMSESDISSSAMQQKDVADWIKRFRWNMEDYDIIQP